MKKFARFVGRFPFAGKLAIRPLVFLFYESRTRAQCRFRYSVVATFILVFAMMHEAQIRSGWRLLQAADLFLIKAFSFLYVFANVCSVIVQFYLTWRMTRFLMVGSFPRRKKALVRLYSMAEAGVMLTVTLGVQFFFIFLYRLHFH